MGGGVEGGREREREREREGERERQTSRQTDRQTDKDRESFQQEASINETNLRTVAETGTMGTKTNTHTKARRNDIKL